MRRPRLIYFTIVAIFAAILSVRTMAQTAPSDAPPQNGGGGPGGNGAPPPPPPPLGFHLIPPFVMDRLDLTDDEQQQVDQLEKETAAKLAKILTPQQWKTLQTTRRPHRGGGGPGGLGDNGARDGRQGNGGPGDGPGAGGPGPDGPGGGGQGGNQGPPN